MAQRRHNSGFTLIAALLILVLLSGVAAGLLYLVTNESRMSGNDLETNLAYYGAESGMEKLTADLSGLYTQYMSPTSAQIQNLVDFSAHASHGQRNDLQRGHQLPAGCERQSSKRVEHGERGSESGAGRRNCPHDDAGNCVAARGGDGKHDAQCGSCIRPVFQFGVFCGYDCSYFPGPNFSFGGRVHTNGSLFLAAGGDLVFNDKVAAYQQIVMDQLENGHMTTTGYGGTVFVPKANAGCPLNIFPPTGTNCVSLPGAGTVPGDASWSGGFPGVGGAVNPNFPVFRRER